MADVTLRSNQNVDVVITDIKDASGNQVTGATITWGTDGPFTLTPSADGLTCNVRTTGNLTASSNVVATASIDGTSGSKTLTFAVIHAGPLALVLTPGTPAINT